MTAWTSVFFYGLFMDAALLADKGLQIGQSEQGYVDGFRLRIGQRATLLPDPGSRTYGVLMTLEHAALEVLYSEPSVSDYLPQTVDVVSGDGSIIAATCYNLPAGKVAGTNPDYAARLLTLATRLEFPRHYLDEIQLAGS